jgi:hypothetical protein
LGCGFAAGIKVTAPALSPPIRSQGKIILGADAGISGNDLTQVWASLVSRAVALKQKGPLGGAGLGKGGNLERVYYLFFFFAFFAAIFFPSFAGVLGSACTTTICGRALHYHYM